MLLSLREAVSGVHDIRLFFDCPGLYSHLKLVPDEGNGDKRLSPMKFEKGRFAKIVVHATSSVSVFVGCSATLPRHNLSELFFVLERVRDRIEDQCRLYSIRVPLFADWIVVMWHYGKDGEAITGKSLDVTFRDFSDIMCRLYAKSSGKGQVRYRLERIESPRKTLRELTEETLNETSDSDEEQ